MYTYISEKFHCVLFQATVLEEMPAFPDRESSLLNKLYETAPWTAKLHQVEQESNSGEVATTLGAPMEPVVNNAVAEPNVNIGQPVDSLINTSMFIYCFL